MDDIFVALMDFPGDEFSEYLTFLNKKFEMQTGGIVFPAYKTIMIVF